LSVALIAMDKKDTEPTKSVKLSPEVKSAVPEWITILQKLQKEAEAETKQGKIEKPQPEKKVTTPVQGSQQTYLENLSLLVSVLKDISVAVHKDDNLTPAEKRIKVLDKLQQKISDAFEEAKKELDNIR
jgi:hypothetical protein